MTKKRFHKLFYSEISKLMKGNPKAGQVMKNALTCTPVWEKIPEGPNYQAAWDMVRKAFVDLDYNKGKLVPEK